MILCCVQKQMGGAAYAVCLLPIHNMESRNFSKQVKLTVTVSDMLHVYTGLEYNL